MIEAEIRFLESSRVWWAESENPWTRITGTGWIELKFRLFRSIAARGANAVVIKLCGKAKNRSSSPVASDFGKRPTLYFTRFILQIETVHSLYPVESDENGQVTL